MQAISRLPRTPPLSTVAATTSWTPFEDYTRFAAPMENLFVYIVGPPGVGKYTVASSLAARMPAKLVDNHFWLNPIFGLIQQDGITPLPKQVWVQVERLRAVVLETIATLSPREWSFVFTHGFVNSPRDYEIAGEIFAAAERRSAQICVVRLTCTVDELAKRVVTPERRVRFKEVDPDAARRNASLPLFDAGDRKTITIETSTLTAEATVDRILQELP
jgi:adenylate kinase family enzyme